MEKKKNYLKEKTKVRGKKEKKRKKKIQVN